MGANLTGFLLRGEVAIEVYRLKPMQNRRRSIEVGWDWFRCGFSFTGLLLKRDMEIGAGIWDFGGGGGGSKRLLGSVRVPVDGFEPL